MSNDKQEIIKSSDAAQWLMPTHPSATEKSRLNKFLSWLYEKGGQWLFPDLAAYRDYMLNEGSLSPASTLHNLGTIRSRYAALLINNDFSDWLWQRVAGDTLADKQALFDQVLLSMTHATNAKNSSVKVIRKQDEANNIRQRLNQAQIDDLLRQPARHHGLDNIVTLRDTAIIAVWVGMGLRSEEVARLEEHDLRQFLDGELALKVRKGKGFKQRLIPYGSHAWVLKHVAKWLDVSGITEAKIFRGIPRGGTTLRKGGLTVRSLDRILLSYPIKIDGQMTPVKGLDLQATYARILWVQGMSIDAIKANMGLEQVETTKQYIGEIDLSARVPDKGIYEPTTFVSED